MIVTSGGTRVPIDGVRVITNTSAGTTGALISETALSRGHTVHYLCSTDTRSPFQGALTLDLNQKLVAELKRVSESAPAIFTLAERLTIERAQNFEEYRSSLLRKVGSGEVDVAIVAMAASDYAPVPQAGKIGSKEQALRLELRPLPKIISSIKAERREVFLVGFKLEIGVSPDQLIEAAFERLRRDKQDLVVANVAPSSIDPTAMFTYLVTPERGIQFVPRADLPTRLIETIEARYSRSHFRTELNTVATLPVPDDELESFQSELQKLSDLALFDPYGSDEVAQFGFLAKRARAGALITARGSSKASCTVQDLAVIRAVDLGSRTVRVDSLGKKASLNGPLAALIFAAREEISWILHAHIPLDEATSTGRDSTPGTLEDWESVEPLVRAGHTVISQPNHGVLILLRDLSELRPLLERNNSYHQSGARYDIVYGDFLRRDELIDEFAHRVPRTSTLLDLAGGSGEVTTKLLSIGYRDITIVDAAAPMLTRAREKLNGVLPKESFQQRTFQSLDYEGCFDGVICRQAINYLAPHELTVGFQNIHRALRSDGLFAFNSFNPALLRSGMRKPVRHEDQDRITITRSGNSLLGQQVLHGQRSESYDLRTGEYSLFYDLNSFWSYQADEFESAARTAGFGSVEIFAKGGSVYGFCKKSG
jgi:phosphopantothenoylcysteine decarboxylase/phosphopantothenate--cysteine ligase